MEMTRSILAITMTVAIFALMGATFFHRLDPSLGPYIYFSLGGACTIWLRFVVGYYFPNRR
jgi:hypothetical protein